MLRMRNLLVAFVLVAAAAGANLYAQSAGGNSSAGIAADMSPPKAKKDEMSPQQMRVKADSLIADMQSMLERMLALQKSARDSKDIIKLNCVNDKLLQLKQLLNIAERSRDNLIEAIAQQDEGARYHQFEQVKIAREKAATLRDEAEACIGEELVFVGNTKVTVSEPPIPDDPTKGDNFFGWDIEEPGYASPFR